MRLRVKGSWVNIFDCGLNKMPLVKKEDYFETVLPMYGIYKIQRSSSLCAYVKYTSTGIDISNADGTQFIPFAIYNDGLNNICMVG